MPTPIPAAFPIVLLAALTACGGGGGGGGSTIREVPFSFSAIASNQTVVLTGLSLTGEGTTIEGTTDSVFFGRTADSFLSGSPDDSNSTATLSYGANRDLSGLAISTPASSVSFSASDMLCDPAGCVGVKLPASTTIAVVLNPLDPLFGWNYQTFGVWLKDTSPAAFQLGAISVGGVSPASALALSSGTFTGHALGWWIDGGGALHSTSADMTAIANFSTRKIDFSTTNTSIDGLAPASTDLNLSGRLDYGTGNQFSGTVTAARIVDPLSGTATGRFYGPNAEEIGGVYGLSSTTTSESMIGAFGGKR
jgi:hypothetical protein